MAKEDEIIPAKSERGKVVNMTEAKNYLFWFFGDFRCGALLFMVIHVIYKYKNK